MCRRTEASKRNRHNSNNSNNNSKKSSSSNRGRHSNNTNKFTRIDQTVLVMTPHHLLGDPPRPLFTTARRRNRVNSINRRPITTTLAMDIHLPRFGYSSSSLCRPSNTTALMLVQYPPLPNISRPLSCHRWQPLQLQLYRR